MDKTRYQYRVYWILEWKMYMILARKAEGDISFLINELIGLKNLVYKRNYEVNQHRLGKDTIGVLAALQQSIIDFGKKSNYFYDLLEDKNPVIIEWINNESDGDFDEIEYLEDHYERMLGKVSDAITKYNQLNSLLYDIIHNAD